MIKPLQFSSPSRMEYAAVLYFLRNGVKLHFYSLGTIFEENMKGVGAVKIYAQNYLQAPAE